MMEWEPFLRFVAAAVFAGAIGLDRELRAKPAGLRTNIVVGVASAAFAYVSVTSFPELGTDNSRVAAQIVSGIGFLGGGAIFASGGKPHGLTTAAALWGSAAAGMAAGVGAYVAGAALVGVTLLALWPLNALGRTAFGRRRRQDAVFHLVVRDLGTATAVRSAIRELGVRLSDLKMNTFGEQVSMRLVLHGTPEMIEATHDRIIGTDGVEFASEESIPQFRR
jgi:putative Mg2+ transporter-C (MgtC) family protein